MRWLHRLFELPPEPVPEVVPIAVPAVKVKPKTKPKPRAQRRPAPPIVATPPPPPPSPKPLRPTLAHCWPEVAWMPSYHRRVFSLLVLASLTVAELDRAMASGCRYPASRAVERLTRMGMIRPVALLGPETTVYHAVPPTNGTSRMWFQDPVQIPLESA